MKVCFLLGGFTKVGGIGRVTSILANELTNSSDINISIISFSNRNLPILYELDESIKHDYLLNHHTSMKKALLSGSIKKLRKYLIKNEIDILIACGALYYPISLLSAMRLKTKVICWEHSNLENTIGYRFQKQARYLASKMADKIVVLTEADKHDYEKKYKINKVRRIYNPVDSTIELHRRTYDSNSKKIISVGRLSYQKNFQNLVEIASKVLPKYNDWTWDIFGEGEDFDELSTMINDFNLQNQLFLKGRVNNLYDLYNDYSFLVMTSRFEGFPMTLLEGMAFGLPLVSYDIRTGPNEIIIPNKNGYLIPSKDKDEMIKKIDHLIESPIIRQEMSKANLDQKDNYSLESIVNQWKVLFAKLLS